MKKKKRRVGGFIIFLVLTFIITGLGAIYAFSAFGDFLNYEPQGEEAKTDKPESDRINVLLIGTDKGGVLTDVIILASFDLKEKNIKIASIPRDTRVTIKGHDQKINAANPLGGINLLIEKVKEITGAPIHHYAKIDTDGFDKVIDILGGVYFDVPQKMKYKDPVQGLDINLEKGYQFLDGDKAEQLVRFRRYVNGDVDRVKVQQAFIEAVIDQKLKPDIIPKIPDLFGQITKYVETDIRPMDVIKNLKFASILFDKDDDVFVESVTIPGEGKYVGNVSYYLHDEEETLALFKEKFGGTGEPWTKENED